MSDSPEFSSSMEHSGFVEEDGVFYEDTSMFDLAGEVEVVTDSSSDHHTKPPLPSTYFPEEWNSSGPLHRQIEAPVLNHPPLTEMQTNQSAALLPQTTVSQYDQSGGNSRPSNSPRRSRGNLAMIENPTRNRPAFLQMQTNQSAALLPQTTVSQYDQSGGNSRSSNSLRRSGGNLAMIENPARNRPAFPQIQTNQSAALLPQTTVSQYDQSGGNSRSSNSLRRSGGNLAMIETPVRKRPPFHQMQTSHAALPRQTPVSRRSGETTAPSSSFRMDPLWSCGSRHSSESSDVSNSDVETRIEKFDRTYGNLQTELNRLQKMARTGTHSAPHLKTVDTSDREAKLQVREQLNKNKAKTGKVEATKKIGLKANESFDVIEDKNLIFKFIQKMMLHPDLWSNTDKQKNAQWEEVEREVQFLLVHSGRHAKYLWSSLCGTFRTFHAKVLDGELSVEAVNTTFPFYNSMKFFEPFCRTAINPEKTAVPVNDVDHETVSPLKKLKLTGARKEQEEEDQYVMQRLLGLAEKSVALEEMEIMNRERHRQEKREKEKRMEEETQREKMEEQTAKGSMLVPEEHQGLISMVLKTVSNMTELEKIDFNVRVLGVCSEFLKKQGRP